MTFLEGIGVAGYRSFRKKLQLFGPLKQLNIVVGQNNCGKSNVLSFLKLACSDVFRAAQSSVPFGLKNLDVPLDIGGAHFGFAIGASTNSDWFDRRMKEGSKPPYTAPVLQFIRDIDSFIWFEYTSNGGRLELNIDDLLSSIDERYPLGTRESRHYNPEFLRSDRDQRRQILKKVLSFLSPIHSEFPPVRLIPAIRFIQGGEWSDAELGGSGLVQKLAELQNPPFNRRKEKERFDRINAFLQEVVGSSSAKIHVPHGLDHIEVEIEGKVLPLNGLGTGVQEVIILAAISTVYDGSIICLEEPEIHLHPTLQRKLLRYLVKNTTNQYFVTTHSAHLLDAVDDAAIFHARLHEGETQVEGAIDPRSRVKVCADLGYRSSDLLQSNYVVWVEGPSDRIYLKRWLELMDGRLVEGIHYTVMFYGGRLLSHLTYDDDEVDEFIKLQNLNRYASILIDSDKSSSHSRISKTKRRIKKEFDSFEHGMAWITNGREIENYIDARAYRMAFESLYQHGVLNEMENKYSRVTRYLVTKGRQQEEKPVDKVKMARCLCDVELDLKILDLEARLSELVGYITQANDLE